MVEKYYVTGEVYMIIKYNLNKIEKIYCFTIIVLLFHITRNINIVLYVVTLFSSYFILFLYYFFGRLKHKIKYKIKNSLIDVSFLVSLIWVPFISLIHMNLDEFF